jgi:hypothetical protein
LANSEKVKSLPTGDREGRSGGRRSLLIAVCVLAALTLCMFGDAVIGDGARVLSNSETDLASQFIYWRDFGFTELSRGNLALWNPHVFCGAPFMGNLRSALLYPLNAFFMIMPVAGAVNFNIALHVFLLGLFTYLWVSGRGLHPVAGMVAAAIAMFCTPYFLHIYAGHLDVLTTMVWAPLLFLALDRLIETASPRWCLLGAFAVAMQILAGHVQLTFYTGVAAVIYAAANLVVCARRGRVALLFACIYAGGSALGAVQLLTAAEAASEGTRGPGLPYEVAASLSFAPENFLTLIAPNFFGDASVVHPYWGRGFLWEVSIFVGIIGLVLAAYGAVKGHRTKRRFSAMLILALLILALGSRTPLFRILYQFVPGFAKFRCIAKFIIPAAFFVALLAGVGLDRLIRRGRAEVWIVVCALAAAIITTAAAVAFYLSSPTEGLCRRIMDAVAATKEQLLLPEDFPSAAFGARASQDAAGSLVAAAGTLWVLSGLLLASRYKLAKAAIYGIALLAVMEVFIFARLSLDTFSFATARQMDVQVFLSSRPGDYRIFNKPYSNSAAILGVRDVCGYEPASARRRYAEFMAYTQGRNPDVLDEYTDYLWISTLHPLYRMLGLRYIFFLEGGMRKSAELAVALPRLWLVHDYAVVAGRDAIFAAMSADFDPARKVILESPPDPAPVNLPEPPSAKIIDSSTDHLTIEADLSTQAILVISEAYDSAWRASPLPGSSQNQYKVMPANYCLRAVPLAAGRHRFRMEYRPTGFVVGKWISVASALAFAALLAWSCWSGRRSRLPDRAGIIKGLDS